MPLTDPSGGAGYAFGAVLPSSHMTTIATNQPKALSEVGGTHTLSAALAVNGTGANKLSSNNVGAMAFKDASTVAALWQLLAGGMLQLSPEVTIATTNNQTLTPAGGQVLRFAPPSVGSTRIHDLVAAGNGTRLLILVFPATGSDAIVINRSGFSGAGNHIVTRDASTLGTAILYDDGTNWRGLIHFGCTVGADW